MTNYRVKPEIVEAVQWSPGMEHPGIQYMGIYPFVQDRNGTCEYLQDGCWIIAENAEGRYRTACPMLFEHTYEELPLPRVFNDHITVPKKLSWPMKEAMERVLDGWPHDIEDGYGSYVEDMWDAAIEAHRRMPL